MFLHSSTARFPAAMASLRRPIEAWALLRRSKIRKSLGCFLASSRSTGAAWVACPELTSWCAVWICLSRAERGLLDVCFAMMKVMLFMVLGRVWANCGVVYYPLSKSCLTVPKYWFGVARFGESGLYFQSSGRKKNPARRSGPPRGHQEPGHQESGRRRRFRS